jgi:hypothetical protein
MVARSRVADAVYRALLHLYPARFQEEFAADMTLDFADASDDAWLSARWPGLIGVWARTAVDVTRSMTVQWLRTGVPLVAVVAIVIALTTVSMAFSAIPDEPLFAKVRQQDRDLTILFFMTACVLLIIAATIIFSLWFLRPLLYRKAPAAMRARG